MASTVASVASRASFGAIPLPCPSARARRICAATSRATGAEKRSCIGRSGMHGASARSRSQVNSAVKRSRTSHSKRRGARVTTFGLLAAAMPGPHTSFTPAAGGSGRWQVSTATRSASWSLICWLFSSAARGAPSTQTTGTRSPTPCTSHHALRRTVSATTGPFRRSSQCWSSSTCAPSYGSTDSTAGPPDEKRNSRGPSSVPFSGFQVGAIVSWHATPGGSASFRS